MRVSEESGHPARIELNDKYGKIEINEARFATVKKTPFFLSNREFVFKIIWKSVEGLVYVAVESLDDKVKVDEEYKVRLRKTRGRIWAIYKIEDVLNQLGVNQVRRSTLFDKVLLYST